MSVFCYSHNIDAWRRKTAHLSFEERGAYRELMDAFYATDGRLPSDLQKLYRITGAQTRSEKHAVAKIVREFFTETDRFLSQKHCAEELSRIQAKREKAASSARAKYNNNNDVAPANAERTHIRTQSERISERSANYNLISNNQELSSLAVPELARATDAAPPPQPEKNPATEIIAALDRAIIQHFGSEHERIAPASMDFVTAKRWVDAGATVEACSAVIDSVVARQRARGKQPPKSLSYFENPMLEALAKPNDPAPDMSPSKPIETTLAPDIADRLRRTGLSDSEIVRWFDKAKFLDGGKVIEVTGSFVSDWIVNHYESQLRSAFGTTPEIRVAA